MTPFTTTGSSPIASCLSVRAALGASVIAAAGMLAAATVAVQAPSATPPAQSGGGAAAPKPSIPGAAPGSVPGAQGAKVTNPARVDISGRWRDAAGRFIVGVRFTMQPDWHIYWRNPGDSGLPPKFETALPPGWTQGPTIFARPDVFKSEHETTIGYAQRAVLFVPFEAEKNAAGGDITIAVRYLICKQACIAGEATLKLKLLSEEELAVLPAFPSVVDGRSIPAPLASVEGSAEFRDGRLLVKGTYPYPVSDPPQVGFLSFDHPGFSLEGGSIASGTLANGHFTVTLGATRDHSLPPDQVPAIGGLVTFGRGRADPCVDFSIQVPATSAR